MPTDDQAEVIDFNEWKRTRERDRKIPAEFLCPLMTPERLRQMKLHEAEILFTLRTRCPDPDDDQT